MSNSSSNNDVKLSEVGITFLTMFLVIALVNCAFFFRNVGQKTAIKVDNVGNTVYLQYANQKESYSIDGIDNSEFNSSNGIFSFFDINYEVSDDGQPYCIVNSKGKTVGTVRLAKRNPMESSVYMIDVANLENFFVSVSGDYDTVYVYSSVADMSFPVSIQIEQRNRPIEVIFEDVRIHAPELSPVLYCVHDVDVNVEAKGTVWLEAGSNSYTTQHVSEIENLFSTINVAANAYYVCMISAIGTAASIMYGVDYYADMFMGVTALQLNVMENAWGKVENLFNGQDGADGLDGVPAIQIAGGLNLVVAENASIAIVGGSGADGGNGTNALTMKNNGGDGGDGASAIVCGILATHSQGTLTLYSGAGGQGGEPGYTPLGDHGSRGNRGSQNETKVVLEIEITQN